jgi:hypothetical protein
MTTKNMIQIQKEIRHTTEEDKCCKKQGLHIQYVCIVCINRERVCQYPEIV